MQVRRPEVKGAGQNGSSHGDQTNPRPKKGERQDQKQTQGGQEKQRQTPDGIQNQLKNQQQSVDKTEKTTQPQTSPPNTKKEQKNSNQKKSLRDRKSPNTSGKASKNGVNDQQDSADIDENIVNLDVTINQSKEENCIRLKEVKRYLDASFQQTDRNHQLKLDLSLPVESKKQIYHITNEFPVQRPYSSPTEWQKILSKHANNQTRMINDKFPEPEEDQLMENILNLNNKNWIRDQISLHNENQNAMQDSLDSLVRQKKAIQLREHFTWLVWAVAHFYFRTNHYVNNDPVVQNQRIQETLITQMTKENQSETQSDYQSKSILNLNSNSSIVSNITNAQNQSKINNMVGGVSSRNNKPFISSTGLPIKLPKTLSPQWNQGFTFKGVYFRLMPYEDAEQVREEIKALRYAQIELLDLQALEQSKQSEENSIGSKPKRGKSQLHKEMILPFLVGIRCAGFFLYGTPLIYTQEMQQDKPQSQDNSFIQNVFEQSSFEFCLPRLGSCVPEFNINLSQLKERESFGYLHDNIDDEHIKDPALELMPILKNISKKNLIPIIDFEEFNNIASSKNKPVPSGTKPGSLQAAGSPRNQNITINYLAVYLSITLRTLSQESTSSSLFKIPQLNSEEIKFYPFPLDKQIQYSELDNIMMYPQLTGPGASLKPKGDISYSPKNFSLQLSNIQAGKLEQFEEEKPKLMFSKRFLQKHGWRFAVIEKVKSLQSPNIGNENKRAFTVYSQRENFDEEPSVKPQLSAVPGSQTIFDTRVKVQENEMTLNFSQLNHNGNSKVNQEDRTPRKEDYSALNKIKKQNQQRKEEIKTGRENLESSPEMAKPSTLNIKHNNIPIFISPKKKSILRRPESNSQTTDEPIFGNCMFAGVFMRGFKLQLSLSAHTYSSGIETMFQMSLDSVAKILDHSDRIYNINAYKELLQRKGLNLRFSWILLTKVKLQQSRDIIMMSILCRTMRRIVNEEVKIKSKIGKKAFTKITTFQNPGTNTVSVERTEHYQSQINTYKEIIVLYANAVLKNKFAKYKQVFEETLLGLFLNRLRILSLANTLELQIQELNYLESKDIIDHIVELPSRNPILFLNSIQAYFCIQLKPEFVKQYRQDKYLTLNKSQPLLLNEIRKVDMHIVTYFTMKDQAYLILARKISFNKKQRDRQVKIENQKIAKVFQKPKTTNYEGNFTERERETSRQNQRQQVSKSGNHQKGFDQSLGKDTQRAFQNMNLPVSVSMTSNGSVFGSAMQTNALYQNYQNIIDLSKVKKSGFTPSTTSEIFLPSVLYKLQTQVQQPLRNTIFQPYYEMTNMDVINEWVIVLESLFKDVYSAQGSEQVLIEALVYQCLLTFFIDADQDSAYKVLTKIRDLLGGALFCAPEIIVMCMTLTGLLMDTNEEIEFFPIESEKSYLAAMVLAFQIYGDPRGRGNYSIPYLLFFSWKLSLLALAEGRKINDSELSEELFDATLSSLFNHKRMYKSYQIDIVAAQEHASQQREINLNQSNINQTQDGIQKKAQNFNLHFELAQELQEMRNNHFNIKKYKNRAKKGITTAGFTKPGPSINNTTNAYLSNRKGLDIPQIPDTDNYLAINKPNSYLEQNQSARSLAQKAQLQHENLQNSQLASKIQNKTGIKAHPSIQSTINLKEAREKQVQEKIMQITLNLKNQRDNNDEIDLSDLEFDMLDSYRKIRGQEEVEQIEDGTQSQLKKQNFRATESIVGNIPFPHWTINRQICASQQQVLLNEKAAEAKRMQKEFIRDHIIKSLDLDAMFAWLINYNPMMVSTGIQWDSRTIKEVVFCPNQNIVNSSDSSIAFSNNKLSQYSYKSDCQPQKKKKQHLGPYSQSLSKEAGGIQKGEIMGLLYTWGTDQYGQLGLDNFVAGKQLGSMQSMKVLHPRLLVSLKNELIKEICCGYSHTLAVNQYGQMYVWGNNEQGQLGLGYDNIPSVVRKPVLNNLVQNVLKVSASHEHSLALTKMQELYSWGSSMLTGLNDTENRHVPAPMEFFKNQKIVQVACGGLHSMVLTKKGILFAWGSAEGGQIGIPELDCESINTPQKIEFLAQKSQRVIQVACGEAHTVALTEEGKIWGWGMSMYGQLGLGFSGDSFEPGIGMQKSRVNQPTEITPFLPPDVKIAKIHCGAMFTLFITEEKELYGCGINDLGQLGLDTYLEEMQVAAIERARQSAGINGIRNIVTSDVTVPSRVICFENMKVNSLACGENHSLATIGEDKSLWAWGMFKNGQLGLGEVSFKCNPRPVQALCNTNIHRLAAGSQHSLALLGDSTQLQNLSHSFYLNSDLLNNPWGIDMRKLGQGNKNGDSMNEQDS